VSALDAARDSPSDEVLFTQLGKDVRVPEPRDRHHRAAGADGTGGVWIAVVGFAAQGAADMVGFWPTVRSAIEVDDEFTIWSWAS
jgi:hypothetical protein